jgi:type II secretory pathway pseudopilin PulG
VSAANSGSIPVVRNNVARFRMVIITANSLAGFKETASGFPRRPEGPPLMRPHGCDESLGGGYQETNGLGKPPDCGSLTPQTTGVLLRRDLGGLHVMKIRPTVKPNGLARQSAFTLAEVVISIGIAAISVGGIIYGYILAAQRTEWATYSAAAQMMAIQRMEQVREAKWDPLGYPAVDDIVAGSFPTIITNLNVALNSTNAVLCTNTIVISQVSSNPLLKKVRIDCAWSSPARKPFTNTIISYRAPDQ